MFLLDSPTELVPTHIDLVVDKISQPADRPAISRTRLLELLDHGLASCASTVLIGRAGTGKTALAKDFAHHSGRLCAWYKVDAPEADIRIFMQYLVGSVRRVVPNFGHRSLNRLVATTELQIPTLAEAFVYELAEAEGEPMLLVIEDLHLVCDAGWVVSFLQRVLPLLPSRVHLLITSRTLPPAPLWRMRSKQTLLVVDEESLAFTRSESIELFNSYGLSPEQASIALDHTHGRAAALIASAEHLSQQNQQL